MAGHRDDGTLAEDKAHHPNRNVSRDGYVEYMMRNANIGAPGKPYEPMTVLEDTSEGVPGHYYDPNSRIEGWADMMRDDMNIDENAGNPYDEAYGPRDMTRRPPVGEWDNEDVFMTPEKDKR